MISLYSQEEIDEMFIHEIREEAKKEIREEIREECKRKVREEGRREGREEMATEMIKINIEPSMISKVTHLSLERINELKEGLSAAAAE